MFNLNPKLIAVKTILDACKVSSIHQYALIDQYAETVFGKENPITQAVQACANKKDENLWTLLTNILGNPELTQKWENLTPAISALGSNKQKDFVLNVQELAKALAGGAELDKWSSLPLFEQLSMFVNLDTPVNRYMASVVIEHAQANYLLNSTQARQTLIGEHERLIKSLNNNLSNSINTEIIKCDSNYLSSIKKIIDLSSTRAGKDRVPEIIQALSYLGGDYSLLSFFARQWDLATHEKNETAIQQLYETVPFLIESALYPFSDDDLNDEGEDDELKEPKSNLSDNKIALGNLWRNIQVSDSDSAAMLLSSQVDEIFTSRAQHLKDQNEFETDMSEFDIEEPMEAFVGEIEIDDDMIPQGSEVPNMALISSASSSALEKMRAKRNEASISTSGASNKVNNSLSDNLINTVDDEVNNSLNDNLIKPASNETSNSLNDNLMKQTSNELSDSSNDTVETDGVGQGIAHKESDTSDVKLQEAKFNVLPPAFFVQYSILSGALKNKGLSDDKYEMFVHKSATPDNPDVYAAFNAFKESLEGAKNVLAGNPTELDQTRTEQEAVKRYFHRIKGSAKMYGADLLGAVALLVNNMFVYRNLDCGEKNFEHPGVREFVENVTGMLLTSCDSDNYPLTDDGSGIEWRVPYLYVVEQAAQFTDKQPEDLIDNELLALFDYDVESNEGEGTEDFFESDDDMDSLDDFFANAIENTEVENQFVSDTAETRTSEAFVEAEPKIVESEVAALNDDAQALFSKQVGHVNNDDVSGNTAFTERANFTAVAMPEIHITSQKIYCKGIQVEPTVWLKAQSNIKKQGVIIQDIAQELTSMRSEGVDALITGEPNIYAILHNEFKAIHFKDAADFFLEVLFILNEYAAKKVEIPIEPYYYMNYFLSLWLQPFLTDKGYENLLELNLSTVKTCFDSIKQIALNRSIEKNQINESIITQAVVAEVTNLLEKQQREHIQNNKQVYDLLSEINLTCAKVLSKTGGGEGLSPVDRKNIEDTVVVMKDVFKAVSSASVNASKSYKYAKIAAFKLAPELFPNEGATQQATKVQEIHAEQVHAQVSHENTENTKQSKLSLFGKLLGQKKGS